MPDRRKGRHWDCSERDLSSVDYLNLEKPDRKKVDV